MSLSLHERNSPEIASHRGTESQRNEGLPKQIVVAIWRKVDVFVREPFDFDAEWSIARIEKVAPDLMARIVRLEVLLELKRDASRPQDLADIEALTKLYEE